MDKHIDIIIEEITNKYKDKTIDEIKNLLNIHSNSKSENHIVFKKMLEVYNDGEIIELMQDSKYVLKTVNFEWNGNLRESISLPAFKYIDIAKEEWEQSSLREYLANNSFVFFCVRKLGKQKYFKGFQIWKMPLNILDNGVKDTWEKTKDIIIKGDIVKYIDKKGRYITNLPGKGDTKYIHVRPHARNSLDEIELPTIDKVTKKNKFVKYSFWLNNSLIKKSIDRRKI